MFQKVHHKHRGNEYCIHKIVDVDIDVDFDVNVDVDIHVDVDVSMLMKNYHVSEGTSQ